MNKTIYKVGFWSGSIAINLSIQFSKEVKKLFSQSKNISDKTFHQQHLLTCPKPCNVISNTF